MRRAPSILPVSIRIFGLCALLLGALLQSGQVRAQAVCPVPGTGTQSVSGIVNSYWDGSNDTTLSAGDTSLVLGVARSGNPVTNIVSGDILLVIQVQDGLLEDDDTANYGSNTGNGMGTTNAENAGRHQFVVASSGGTAGSTINFSPALTHAYVQAAATTTRGQRRYQVIHVPRYGTATVAGVEAPAWNGLTGGVVAIDVAQTLTLGNGTVEGISNRAIFVAGRGFRGAAGVQGDAGSPNTEWRRADGAITGGIAHGGKGEGIAGTPRYLASKSNNYGDAVTTATLTRIDTGSQGYPQGDRARGAPGNAGGGGTDGGGGNNNQENAGGGGGGNYAPGGLGGRPWNAPLVDSNGRGGAGYAGTIAFDRVILGGGGGSGGTNNGTDDANTYANNLAIACGTQTNGNTSSGTAYGQGICSSGASGGGVVILRARSITGTGVIDARGGHAYNVRNDAGGGGGAGGSVVLHTVEGGTASINVAGGDGGNAWAGRTTQSTGDRHGPGGGGGGGFIAFTPSAMAVNATLDGGSPGRTTNGVSDTYGAFGLNGGLTAFDSDPSTPGILPGAQCLPDLRLSKTNGIDIQLTSGSTTYTLTISNTGAAPTAGTITLVDVLPAQLSVPDGAVALSGPQAANWTCNASGNVLTCTSSVVIAATGSSVFAFVANVTAANGDAIVNRARVGGGGDLDNPTPDQANTAACIGNHSPIGCAVDADVVNAPFLALTKGASTLVAGNPGTYTLVVTNNGSQPTSGTIGVVDVPPTGVSFVSASSSPAGFACTFTAPSIRCSSSTPIGAGSSATITINVNVAATVAGSITNRARVGGGGDPSKPAAPALDGSTTSTCPAPTVPATQYSDALSGCASVTTPVRRVNLSLTKSDGQNLMMINGQTEYGFVVTNSGDAASIGSISFRDVLPAPMTWPVTLVKGGANGADWTCTRIDATNVTCTSAVSVPAGASSAFMLLANVNAATDGALYTNRARIGGGGDSDLLSGTPDSTQTSACTGNNVAPGCAIDLNTAGTGPRIRLAKTHADPQAKNPGDTVAVTLTLTNTGGVHSATGDNDQISVIDAIPAGLTYSPSGGTFASGGFFCTHTAAPAPGFISCFCDGDSDGTNDGNSDCNSTGERIEAGASRNITYNLTVGAAATNSVVNRAQVRGGNDPATGIASTNTFALTQQCSGSQVPYVGCAIDPVPLNANLGVTKLQCQGGSCGTNFANYTASIGPVLPGTPLRYFLRFSNAGPTTVTGALVADDIPLNFTGLSILSATPSGAAVCATGNFSLSGNSLAGTIPSLPSGTQCDVVIATTATIAGTGIQNTATIAAPTGIVDATPANNTSTISTTIASADVGVTKTNGVTAHVPGTSTVYTVEVRNFGPSTATGIQVIDNAPAGTTITGWTCAGGACPNASGSGNVNQTIASLASGSAVVYSITVGIPANYTGSLANTVTVTTTSPDPNPANDTATDTDTVTPTADLEIAKSDGAAAVEAGGSTVYTIVVTNHGPSDVTGATIFDAAPVDLTLGAWTCVVTTPGTGSVTTACGAAAGSGDIDTTANLANGGVLTYTVDAAVASSASGTISNTATATVPAGTTDPACNVADPPCNSATDTNTVTLPDVVVSKTSNPVSGTSVVVGQTITYTLTAVVSDASLSADLVLSDTLGAGLAFGSVTTAGSFTSDTSGNPLVFTLASGTAPGTYSVEYTATVTATSGSVGNSVVTTGGGDPTPNCAVATPCTTNHPVPSLTASATGICINDAPYLDYTIVANDFAPGPNPVTLTFRDSTNAIVGTVSGLPLSGQYLWPGATVDGGGNATDWPGWVFVGGRWIPGSDGFEFTVPVLTVDVSVNPTTSFTVSYPPAAPGCFAQPPIDAIDDAETTPFETPINVAVLDNDSGIAPGSTVTLPSSVSAEGGTMVVNPDGTITYTPPAGFTGVDTFEYEVCLPAPNETICDTATVTITVAAGAPAELSIVKSVESFTATGPGSYRITYRLVVDNVGAIPANYTLSDTLGFPAAGVSFIGEVQVSSADGVVNPALAGGRYTPVNGVSMQISGTDVAIAEGDTDTYLLSLRVAINPAQVDAATCSGTAGNGLFNLATLAGDVAATSPACQTISDEAVSIRLTKTVELGVDFNGNRYGDAGDVLGYVFEIENLGDQPLAAVSLYDPRVPDLACDTTTVGGNPIAVLINDEIFGSGFDPAPPGALPPGDTVLCFASHVLTAADVAARRVYNSATATGRGSDDQVVSSTSTAIFGAFP